MNLFDILFMQKTGKIKPDADLFDMLFAKKLGGGAGVITTLTGNPLSFLAKKAQKAISTKISFAPIQEGEGDPSPTNVRPISGRMSVEIKGCRKNLYKFPYTEMLGLSGSGNNRTIINSQNNQASIIRLEPNTNYYLSGDRTEASDKYARLATFSSYPKVGDVSIRFLSYARNNELTFTTGNNELWALVLSTTGYNENWKMQLELGSSPTEYEPYQQSNDVTISFGETVYGGTLDVETGELVVKQVMMNVNPNNWLKSSSYDTLYLWNSFTGYALTPRVVCNKYKATTSANSMTNAYNKGDCTICLRSGTLNTIYIRDDSYTDITTFRNSMSDLQIVYTLATPRTIQLTPEQIQILKGQNTIWIDDDGATMELSYMD